MSPSKLKGLGLPALVVCLAAGAGVLFQQGRPAPVQGQTTTFDEWDFVPPSPAPSLVAPSAAPAPIPSYALPRPSVWSAPSTTSAPVARPASPFTTAPPALHRHVSATISSAVNSATAPRKTAGGGASSRMVTPLGNVSTTGGVVAASHLETVPSEQPVPEPSRFSFVKKLTKPAPLPTPSFPMDRTSPPSVLGSHLGLQPGETATERSLRLMSAIGDLERHVENITFENATLNAAVKERDDKLRMAVREVRAARKDLVTSRDDLDRLKREVESLREKVRNAEKDNAAVLQTMAPLLQQLLESDDVGGLPTERAE